LKLARIALIEKNKPKWKPVEGHILTRWASEINPELPLPEYPRPQMKREDWQNLNGLWDYAIRSKKTKDVSSYDGKILVPFAVESALSGVKKKFKPRNSLWYHRKFKIPENWNGKNILLHFGAVDWEATVWINGELLGSHKGGNIPFSFDITKFLKESETNKLVLKVLDPTNKGGVERGKQTLKPLGIKYTAVSGIWQTVWLEPVPSTYILGLKIQPSLEDGCIFIKVRAINSYKEDRLSFTIRDENKEIVNISGKIDEENKIITPNPKPWSPESPFLYDLVIQIKRNDKVIDEVTSYFGLRDISVKLDDDGHHRIYLNNKKVYQFGILDQGYWPDGLYTAPTDDALRYDVEITKELGFNMIRKHGKVEPARWYYHCDKLGILVWQDMPSGGNMTLIMQGIGIFFKKRKEINRRKKSQKPGFYKELDAMIEKLYNYPSIIIWVPFNEGWGQFDTKNIVNMIKEKDPTRLINNASGWHDQGVGDLSDCHHYPSPTLPKNIRDRAAVLGEFGGLGLKLKGHVWKKKIKFSYSGNSTSQELLESYSKLMLKLKELIPKGLCASVYTQITDVEGEINGLLTYDREIIKMDKKELKKINLSVYE
jgi:beta-galactosidase/beta-glucuronidase